MTERLRKTFLENFQIIRYGVSFFKCKTESASATSSLGYSIVIGQKRLQPLSGLTPIRLQSASYRQSDYDLRHIKRWSTEGPPPYHIQRSPKSYFQSRPCVKPTRCRNQTSCSRILHTFKYLRFLAKVGNGWFNNG